MEGWEVARRMLRYPFLLLLLSAASALLALLPQNLPAPPLFPLAVALIAAREGPETGAGFGAAAGFLWGFQEGSVGIYPLALSLLGLCCGLLRQRTRADFFGAALAALLPLCGLLLLRGLWWIVWQGAAVSAALPLCGAEAAWCFLLFFAVAAVDRGRGGLLTKGAGT